MRTVAVCCALLGCMWAGVYLIVHDHATIGGWVCILTLLCTWKTPD